MKIDKIREFIALCISWCITAYESIYISKYVHSEKKRREKENIFAIEFKIKHDKSKVFVEFKT